MTYVSLKDTAANIFLLKRVMGNVINILTWRSALWDLLDFWTQNHSGRRRSSVTARNSA